MQKLLDYHLLCLKSDVLFLADVFENFRETAQEYYGLDPANYITSPSMAWDAMLSMTNIELDLIDHTELLEKVEMGKRGGLCYVGSKRHAKANNRYMKDYDETKEENYIMYLDANNLYGWAMSQPLPYKDIKINNDITLEEVLNTDKDADAGYLVEADISFPKELHELRVPASPRKYQS